ncbi:hypothetical protein Tco_0647986 [Tanacetum coccineum]
MDQILGTSLTLRSASPTNGKKLQRIALIVDNHHNRIISVVGKQQGPLQFPPSCFVVVDKVVVFGFAETHECTFQSSSFQWAPIQDTSRPAHGNDCCMPQCRLLSP